MPCLQVLKHYVEKVERPQKNAMKILAMYRFLDNQLGIIMYEIIILVLELLRLERHEKNDCNHTFEVCEGYIWCLMNHVGKGKIRK